MKEITLDTTIGSAIIQKGEKASEIIDKALCNGDKTCCPGTTLTIGGAANLKGRKELVLGLLKQLNDLPNVK